MLEPGMLREIAGTLGVPSEQTHPESKFFGDEKE